MVAVELGISVLYTTISVYLLERYVVADSTDDNNKHE